MCCRDVPLAHLLSRDWNNKDVPGNRSVLFCGKFERTKGWKDERIDNWQFGDSASLAAQTCGMGMCVLAKHNGRRQKVSSSRTLVTPPPIQFLPIGCAPFRKRSAAESPNHSTKEPRDGRCKFMFMWNFRASAKVNGQGQRPMVSFCLCFVQVELRAPSYIYNSIRSGFQPAEDVLSGEKVEFFSWKQRKTAGRRCEKRGATDMKITSFSGKTPKSAHFHLRKRLKKRSKTGNFRKKRDAGKQKQKLFSLTISELPKKWKKKCPEVLRGKGKPPIFAVPIERETGCKPRGKEGESDWECSLKEWKDVANTQGFFWDSQAIKSGQTKHNKKEIN